MIDVLDQVQELKLQGGPTKGQQEQLLRAANLAGIFALDSKRCLLRSALVFPFIL